MRLILIWLVIFAALPSCFAQLNTAYSFFGKVSGRVLDKQSAVVPRARVVIISKNFRQEVRSNDQGFYEAHLPEGKYKIEIPAADGWYGSGRKSIKVDANVPVTRNFVLTGVRMDARHP